MASNRFKAGLQKHHYTGKDDQPPTPADMKLSNKHLIDRMHFNIRHRDEHHEAAQDAANTLEERGVDYQKKLKKLGVEL